MTEGQLKRKEENLLVSYLVIHSVFHYTSVFNCSQRILCTAWFSRLYCALSMSGPLSNIFCTELKGANCSQHVYMTFVIRKYDTPEHLNAFQ